MADSPPSSTENNDDPPTTVPKRSLFSGSGTFNLERTDTMLTIGRFKLRGQTDDLPQDWWFASTAIPLLAATIGPLANVLSIAALVTKWRVTLPNNGQLPEGLDDLGVDIPDPKWEIVLNAISLAMGFLGNFCLLVNFTRRIRYIVALPLTIISWYIATAILISIVVAMNQHDAPQRPGQTYSQGFWHAIIAATLYLIGSMILMINMTGYFLGHYPQHFELDDDQRTLILQTMMFFFWLAGGAAVFSKVSGFTYANALYFCDVTVLTVGFGDIVPETDAGRGIVFPYSVIGIIFLGLMINSIRKFAVGISKDKVIRKHQNSIRVQTVGRTVTSEKELRDRLGLPPPSHGYSGRRPSNNRKASSTPSNLARRQSLEKYGQFGLAGRTITFVENKSKNNGGRGGAARMKGPPMSRDAKVHQRKERNDPEYRRADRRQKLLLLREEKDRFNAMRRIQSQTKRFQGYYALSMSVMAFGVLWCVGALVFYKAEQRIQDMSYFEALYFCYVSLLTIGYGDLSPQSNAGKPFFVIWSLVAIPTMTILISDMGDTVISAINRGTFTLADWTVLPKAGVWADFVNSHPKIKGFLERKERERETKRKEKLAEERIAQGFELQDPDEDVVASPQDPDAPLARGPTIESIADDPPELSEHEMARRLALAMKKTANDLHAARPVKYSYEEWVEFTKLIRFSKLTGKELEEAEDDEGLVEWDWIGEDSPMLADVSESEWILDRLCESLNRYTRKQARDSVSRRKSQIKDPGSTVSSPKTPQHRFAPMGEHYPAHPGHRFPTQLLSHSSAVADRAMHDEVLKERSQGSSSGSGSATLGEKSDLGENG